jgi:hypothetical protein
VTAGSTVAGRLPAYNRTADPLTPWFALHGVQVEAPTDRSSPPGGRRRVRGGGGHARWTRRPVPPPQASDRRRPAAAGCVRRELRPRQREGVPAGTPPVPSRPGIAAADRGHRSRKPDREVRRLRSATADLIARATLRGGPGPRAPTWPTRPRGSGRSWAPMPARHRGVLAFPLQVGGIRPGAPHLYRSTVGELSRAEPVDAVTFADVGTRLRWGPKAAQDTAPPIGSTLSSRSWRTGRGRGSATSDRHRPLPEPCASIPRIRGWR